MIESDIYVCAITIGVDVTIIVTVSAIDTLKGSLNITINTKHVIDTENSEQCTDTYKSCQSNKSNGIAVVSVKNIYKPSFVRI